VQAASLDFGATDLDQSLTLNYAGSKTIQYEIQTRDPWISVQPSSGSMQPPADTVQLAVTVDRMGLADGAVYVRQWVGDAWVEAGGSSASDGGIGTSWHVPPTGAIAPDGTLYAAWMGGASNGDIQVRRYTPSP